MIASFHDIFGPTFALLNAFSPWGVGLILGTVMGAEPVQIALGGVGRAA